MEDDKIGWNQLKMFENDWKSKWLWHFQLNYINFWYILNASIKSEPNLINFIAMSKNPATNLYQKYNLITIQFN